MEQQTLERWLPPSIVATRGASADSEWRYGEARRFDDTVWLVGKPNPYLIDGGVSELRFDSLVDVGGTRLDDPRLRSFQFTKKLLCLELCMQAMGNISGSRSSIVVQGLYQDWLIRFAIDSDVARNSEFEPCHVDKFIKIAAGGPLLRLVRIDDRLDDFAYDVSNGRVSLENFVRAGTRPEIDWPLVGDRLGVPWLLLAHDNRFRRRFRDHLIAIRPDFPALARSVGPTEFRSVVERTSSGTLRRILRPLEMVYQLSNAGRLADPFPFDPFDPRERGSRQQVSLRRGAPSVQREPLLPHDLFRLLCGANDLICRHGKAVVAALREVQGSRGVPVAGSRAVEGPVVGSQDTLLEAVRYLMTACAVLIAALTARRPVQVKNLSAGCVTRSGPDGYEISVWAGRSFREFEAVPIPELARRAVELLEELTLLTRERTGNPWLLQILYAHTRRGDAFLSCDLNEMLKTFPEACGLPPPEGRSEWRLTSLQLSAGFAILYYHGNDFAAVDDLTQLTGAFDPMRTWRYVHRVLAGKLGELRERIDAAKRRDKATMSEEDKIEIAALRQIYIELRGRRATFEQVRREALARTLCRVQAGVEGLSGRGAPTVREYLGRLAARAAARVRIESRLNDPDAILEPLEKILLREAKDYWLEPVPNQPNHCIARPSDETNRLTAECLKARTEAASPGGLDEEVSRDPHRPDPAFTNSYVCLKCVHCVFLDSDRRRIRKVLDAIEIAAPDGTTDVAGRDADEAYRRWRMFALDAGVILEGG